MTKDRIEVLGMPLERWSHKSCKADFAVDPYEGWATLYYIESLVEGQGHATELLAEAKAHFEGKGFRFGGSVALNDRMKSIYKKLGIQEYKNEV